MTRGWKRNISSLVFNIQTVNIQYSNMHQYSIFRLPYLSYFHYLNNCSIMTSLITHYFPIRVTSLIAAYQHTMYSFAMRNT